MTNGTNRDAYERRINRVVSYICAHLDEPLTVELLCEVAGFSKFHFHRQFTEYSGFTVSHFVRLTRLKRAAYQLAFDPKRRIIDVALEAGFSAPESFARAFKELQGQTPSDFRRAPDWAALRSAPQPPTPLTSNSMNPEIVEFSETRVAALEHHGPPDRLMASVVRFVEWRKGCRDSPVLTCRTLGINYHDASTTDPEQYRFDICGELSGPLSPNNAGVVEKVIPRGRCAVARHVGSTDAIGETVHQLYAKWLPESGEQLRDFPLFFHYIARMPAVSEHEQVTDVYLPLRDR
jgi:AraC family transcriptional regulator